MGRIIAIEGTDCSGKETQSRMLEDYLKKEGWEVKRVSFPNYSSPSSAPVCMYLHGDLGNDPKTLAPAKISLLYAVDRYITFERELKAFYKKPNSIIIFDRYVSSNFIHQCAKLSTKKEKKTLINYIKGIEHEVLELPEPDSTIFLHMPFESSMELMAKRENKITGGTEKDIHERDEEYMRKSYANAKWISEKEGWTTVDCVHADLGILKQPWQIHEEIVKKLIKKEII